VHTILRNIYFIVSYRACVSEYIVIDPDTLYYSIIILSTSRAFITLTFLITHARENTRCGAFRSQIGYRWQDACLACILDETVLTRNSTFPETEDGYVTYIALPGSGTMRGEWASSAPPRASKTLGYRSLKQSSITIQTPRMATSALYRFYFLKYRPYWRGRSMRRREDLSTLLLDASLWRGATSRPQILYKLQFIRISRYNLYIFRFCNQLHRDVCETNRETAACSFNARWLAMKYNKLFTRADRAVKYYLAFSIFEMRFIALHPRKIHCTPRPVPRVNASKRVNVKFV